MFNKKNYFKNYYREHRFGILEQQKEYRTANPDKEKLRHKKWGLANPNKLEETTKRWKLANPDKVKAQKRRRRALKHNANGSHTCGEWELLRIQYGFRCPDCGESEPDIVLTEDHIIPLSKGGSDYIENIQPLCKSCNSRKGTKTIRYEAL